MAARGAEKRIPGGIMKGAYHLSYHARVRHENIVVQVRAPRRKRQSAFAVLSVAWARVMK